jgi:hypothetical protein
VTGKEPVRIAIAVAAVAVTVAVVLYVAGRRSSGPSLEGGETSPAAPTVSAPSARSESPAAPRPVSPTAGRASPEGDGGVPLADLFAQLRDRWGLTVENRTGRSDRLHLALDDAPSTVVLDRLAARLDLALCGDIAGVGAGTCSEVHITPHALYAGSDAEMLGLLDSLGSESSEAREDAVSDLADRLEANVEPVLARMLQRDPDGDVRARAAAGLEETSSPGVVEVLIAALSDPSEDVREHARASLAFLDKRVALERLKKERSLTQDRDKREMIDQILEETFGQEIMLDDE